MPQHCRVSQVTTSLNSSRCPWLLSARQSASATPLRPRLARTACLKTSMLDRRSRPDFSCYSSDRAIEHSQGAKRALQSRGLTKAQEYCTCNESQEGAKSHDVKSALKALKWYKAQISPLLPRSCRFVPTCSEYSMEAYQTFGNTKGTVLTAWRLLRCNPLNFNVKYQGKYDPPRWPPVGMESFLK